MITQERLKELFHYDPETGVLIRLVRTSQNAKVGQEPGYIRKDGYRYIKVDGKQYLAHRLAWLYVRGKFPPEEIDHINGVKDDNRLINLREASRTENNRNRKILKNNSSGFMGVCWHKDTKKWAVEIRANGKRKHLGIFKDLELAEFVRKEAEQLYGYHPNHGRR